MLLKRQTELTTLCPRAVLLPNNRSLVNATSKYEDPNDVWQQKKKLTASSLHSAAHFPIKVSKRAKPGTNSAYKTPKFFPYCFLRRLNKKQQQRKKR